MYYIQYKLNEIYGEMYVVDTSYGCLELGVIENDKIYEEVIFINKSFEEYLRDSIIADNFTYVKVI